MVKQVELDEHDRIVAYTPNYIAVKTNNHSIKIYPLLFGVVGSFIDTENTLTFELPVSERGRYDLEGLL